MKHDIENLISLLDSDKDYLLIELLKQKIQTTKYYDPRITQKEILNANKGMTRIGTKAMLDDFILNPVVKKAKEILQRHACDTCKYSVETFSEYTDFNGVTEIFEYNISDVNNPVCNSCSTKKDRLQDISFFSAANRFDPSIMGEDFIKTRALIIKIQNKLKQLNHETSKH
jgi:hypothetical protein